MDHSKRLTGWRRVAGAMWSAPNDPQIFGALDVDARPVLAFIDEERRRGRRITPTHVVGRAVSHTLQAVPDLNVRIRRGRAYPRPSVDVFFITSVGKGSDLSGVKVCDVPSKSAAAVATELSERSAAMKAGRDRDFSRSKRMMDALPPRILRRALHATAFLTEQLQLDLPMLALRRSPFGSAMITSVGMFGLPQGFGPLAWMYDVPLLVLVGEIAERPVVEAGMVVARPILPITATIDHRYVDGWHISVAMKAFREYLAAPTAFEPAEAQYVSVSPAPAFVPSRDDSAGKSEYR
jgi:pyruvate dehydrogenase E2 component (dihydrolipoamide acetyltransferase)